MKKFRLPAHIKYLITVYFTGIALFTLFRMLLFLANIKQLDALPVNKGSLILQAFLMGFRFDTVISACILSIPMVLLSIAALLLFKRKILSRIITFYTGLLYTAAFLICAIDIPYYKFYNNRLSAIVFNWFDNPGFLLKMTAQDKNNWLYMFVFILSSSIFWPVIFKLRKKFLTPDLLPPGAARLAYSINTLGFSLVAFILLFIGARGRLAVKSPIRVGTAYFSNYSFPNQLGLNPVYTFARSSLDRLNLKNKELHLMPDETAIRLVREYLKIETGENPAFSSPIARPAATGGEPRNANVVLVIMESMAAAKMGRYGNPNHLTPHLDSLAERAYSFDHIYTAGTHTANGIYAALFGFTALFKQHPLKPVSMLTYAGLPNILREKDYSTIFFATHDDQFDNMGGFLRANGFEQVIAEKDYPADKVLSTLGVPDHYMFDFSIPILNRLYEGDRPFLAVFLTGSDHPPHIIPPGISFKPGSAAVADRVVEYADWAIGEFLKKAARQEWFRDTLFVFVADHGANMNTIYDMPLSYFHTPLIFYSPYLIKEPRVFPAIGGQIDVFPTLMGILNIPYVNNTLGIDLLKESRPYIYFCGDDKIGCLDDEYFLVIRDDGGESLYAYKKGDTKNYLAEKEPLARSMKDYFFSMMQATQWLTGNRLVGIQTPQPQL